MLFIKYEDAEVVGATFRASVVAMVNVAVRCYLIVKCQRRPFRASVVAMVNAAEASTADDGRHQWGPYDLYLKEIL